MNLSFALSGHHIMLLGLGCLNKLQVNEADLDTLGHGDHLRNGVKGFY